MSCVRLKKGFTLIELLVVVAIISILASILFPVFARARENARRASCMSNLKQFGLGMMMYVQDYDETYPHYYSGGIAAGNPPGGLWNLGTGNWAWQQILYPYTKSTQIFTCPSGVAETAKIPFRGHYGANNLIINAPTSGSPAVAQSGIKMATIQGPANVYAFMDAGNYTVSYGYARATAAANNGGYIPGVGRLGSTCAPGTTGANYVDDCKSGRHLDGVNVAFADGHVKWLKTEVLNAESLKPAPNLYGAWNPANG